MRKLLLILALFCFININAQTDNKKIIDRLETITDSLLKHSVLPGMVVGVWDKSKNLEWIAAKGIADYSTDRKMNKDLLFRIGSNTKTFVNTVLLQLVGVGSISLDDKLSKYYPDIPNSDSITIEMLTNMTSGLYNYSDTKEFEEELMNNRDKIYTPSELVYLALRYPSYFSPGKGYHYSNTNTILLGMIIEAVTGNKIGDEINTRIIEPLGLKNTYFANGKGMTGDYAHGYGVMGDTVKPLIDYTSEIDVSWAWTAGAMVSNLNDAKIYVEALANGDLIKPEIQKMRLERMVSMVPGKDYFKYGMGMFLISGFIGHNGSIPGYNTLMVSDPVRKCTIVILFNTQAAVSQDKLFGQIAKVLYPDMPW